MPTEPENNVYSVPFKNTSLSISEYVSNQNNGKFSVGYSNIKDIYESVYKINCDLSDFYCSREHSFVNVKEDIYSSYLSSFKNIREIEKISDGFMGNNSYDFKWKIIGEDKFIKGKMMIVKNSDLFILMDEEDKDSFENWEKFIYSWKSFGVSSN